MKNANSHLKTEAMKEYMVDSSVTLRSSALPIRIELIGIWMQIDCRESEKMLIALMVI